jgi:hypothetical protein
VLAQVYDAPTQTQTDPVVTFLTLGIVLVIGLFYVACMWRIFTKAGHPGWYAIVPILNTYTVIKISGRPGWWIWLTFLPCISIVVLLLVYFDLAREFGKGSVFALGTALVPALFLPIIAFGSATYFEEVRPRRAVLPPPGGGNTMTTWGSVGSAGAGAGTPRPAPTLPAPAVAPVQAPPLLPAGTAGPPPMPPMPPVQAGPNPPPSNSPTPVATTPAATASTADAAGDAGPSDVRAAGWYTDPTDADQVRWWDGAAWTTHRRERPGS